MAGPALLAFVHGAAGGLFLLIAGLLWRDRRGSSAGWLGAALALSAASHAIASTPGLFPGSGAGRWVLTGLEALSTGTPVLFWLWARVAFEDEFVPRPWHGAAWAALAGAGLLAGTLGAGWRDAGVAAGSVAALGALGFAILAVAQTLASWGADLVAGRRRLRGVVLAGTLAYIATTSLSGLPWMPAPVRSPHAGLPDGVLPAFGLCVLAALWGWGLFRVVAPSAIATANAPVTPPSATQARPPAADPALLGRLEQLMTAERAHRQEGLTIGTLAARLAVPEYRLRQAINEGMGHRNFNAFLNHYRIGEAKAALADPAQKGVPVLTIAMDAGFQSLGPFNRAFKAATGMTPTEFRRAAEIGQPG